MKIRRKNQQCDDYKAMRCNQVRLRKFNMLCSKKTEMRTVEGKQTIDLTFYC